MMESSKIPSASLLSLKPSFASIRFHERSRQFYERKRREGKRHNAAVVALARRRLNVLYAMMSNHEYYRDPDQSQKVEAA
ncbi:transposase-like protein [Corynebacterium diphtheriae BH8]|nr:transposase-like protein [Corynebacterium diphtheriae BH8]AEX80651.1 transposase-like protein [Corynebacterium diphtheriae HC04]CAB0575830.1 IS110 family transposase [Corynebacterium diphtheriae]